jgi:hypothetical protein
LKANLKKTMALLLLVVFTIALAAPVFANPNQGNLSGSIRDQLRGEFDEDGVIDTLDARASELIRQARIIAGIVAVAFLIMFGYSFFTAGGDPAKYAAAKAKLIGFVIALFFIFSAEAIVGGVLRMMGANL